MRLRRFYIGKYKVLRNLEIIFPSRRLKLNHSESVSTVSDSIYSIHSSQVLMVQGNPQFCRRLLK